jgi:Flp pilus assembly protein TadB
MYGKWFLITFGPIAVILLIIALAVTPWAAIFAVAIALVLGIVFVFGQATRRSQQVGSEHAAAAEDRVQAGRPGGARGAPASGEGGVGDAHAAPQVRDRA